VKEPQNIIYNSKDAGPKRPECFVMVCKNKDEADQVATQLLQVNSATLITYRRSEDLLLNRPAGQVVLFILADGDNAAVLGRILKWLHYRWPDSPMAVVGDEGNDEMEIVARKGGAYFLTRPVAQWKWKSLIQYLLKRRNRKTTRAKPAQ